ncbi:hypothetical protein GQ44DRAFT_688262 [Phaeosphaeriaceae sp. PMI808]|nr:hypothetical protein GQ44DRAFT_688262 [Phaeosphaeriaceae sp. PMI808]
MSAMISQTLQGAALGVASNVIAQAITSYKESAPYSINPTPVLKFAIFSILSNPPNIVWQTLIEDAFPNDVRAPASKTAEKKPIKPSATKTSKKNILIKFLLDQTVGSVMNTLMFVAYMAYLNAAQQNKTSAWDEVVNECKAKTWPMMKDGYKFWPAISLVSFLWIPVHKRVVFGCAAGVLWGIYLSLLVEG